MDLLDPIRDLFGFAFSTLESLSIIRAMLGFILVLFLPGFTWTLVFFKQIRVIERVVISFGLSMVVVTLSLFLMNRLIGVRITGLNSVMIIMVVTIVPVMVHYLNRLIRRREEEDEDAGKVVTTPVQVPPAGEVTAEAVEEMLPEEAAVSARTVVIPPP